MGNPKIHLHRAAKIQIPSWKTTKHYKRESDLVCKTLPTDERGDHRSPSEHNSKMPDPRACHHKSVKKHGSHNPNHQKDDAAATMPEFSKTDSVPLDEKLAKRQNRCWQAKHEKQRCQRKIPNALRHPPERCKYDLKYFHAHNTHWRQLTVMASCDPTLCLPANKLVVLRLAPKCKFHHRGKLEYYATGCLASRGEHHPMLGHYW